MKKRNGKHVSGNPAKRAEIREFKNEMGAVEMRDCLENHIGLMAFSVKENTAIALVSKANTPQAFHKYIKCIPLSVVESFVKRIKNSSLVDKNDSVLMCGPLEIAIVENEPKCIETGLRKVFPSSLVA